ncbi:hypothetical protein IQ13_3227 [Lacibacter cauensis]|uniref:Uncharacterized protein n=1 Tax=Lacibacter cauensis TaxID=510947 RepID=A0A562SGZ9_9BACT|nr:hypothetical protein [Lacibacter cauensis]TWI80549.1 hypothetical protein IQ13_3227 [Lacibacter cauensis]
MNVLQLNTFELYTIAMIVDWTRIYNSYALSFKLGEYGFKDGCKIHLAKMQSEMSEFETALGYCNKTAKAIGFTELKAAVEQLMQEHGITKQHTTHA